MTRETKWIDLGLRGYADGPEGEWREIVAEETTENARTHYAIGRVYVLAATEEARANAKARAALITAAPDLCGALERAFVALGRGGGNTADSPFREAWLSARAALARARGDR